MVEPAAQAAVGARNDILATNQASETQDPLRYQLRMFDNVGGMANNPWDKYLALRKFYLLPHAPFVLVAHIGGLNQISTGAYLEQQADDILERQIRRVRPVPPTPADLIAPAILWNVRQRMVERLDSRRGKLLVLLGSGRRISHVVASHQLWIVYLK